MGGGASESDKKFHSHTCAALHNTRHNRRKRARREKNQKKEKKERKKSFFSVIIIFFAFFSLSVCAAACAAARHVRRSPRAVHVCYRHVRDTHRATHANGRKKKKREKNRKKDFFFVIFFRFFPLVGLWRQSSALTVNANCAIAGAARARSVASANIFALTFLVCTVWSKK
jgi:hypothetical protein